MTKEDKTVYDESSTDGQKKGSVSEGGYNEEQELQKKDPKENPAPPAAEDKPSPNVNPPAEDREK